MVKSSLPAIPWAHSASEFGSIWVWDTPHFVVTVNGSNRSCYYVINAKSNIPGKSLEPFADGTTATFEQAENLIRETIGKSYPPNLGYQHFAGPLATTFVIGTGARVNLGDYIGRFSNLVVFIKDSITGVMTEEPLNGVVAIDNYELILTLDTQTLRISPTFIKSISLPEIVKPITIPLGLDRIFSGKITQECTGKPGIIDGTVEHNAGLCPVHEGMKTQAQ